MTTTRAMQQHLDVDAEVAGSRRPTEALRTGRKRVARRSWLKIAAVAILGPAALTAMAGPAGAATGASERQCVFRYVVPDGAANSVRTFRSARGTTRSAPIRPNESFVVFFDAGDHVAGRQRTDRGWVTFPRSYLRDQHRCASLNDLSAEFATLQQAAARAVSNLGSSLVANAHG